MAVRFYYRRKSQMKNKLLKTCFGDFTQIDEIAVTLSPVDIGALI